MQSKVGLKDPVQTEKGLRILKNKKKQKKQKTKTKTKKNKNKNFFRRSWTTVRIVFLDPYKYSQSV